MGVKIGRWQLDNFEQKQNDNDEQDEADASSAVVAEPWSHAITTEAEHKNQNDQKNKHYCFLRTAKIRQMCGVMRNLLQTQ
jgi:hypothetical protein